MPCVSYNDAKDIFLKSIERLSSDDRLTQPAMAKALGLSLYTFRNKVMKYGMKWSNYKMRETKDTFLKSIERLSSDDRLTQKAMAKALGLNRTTFMRKAKRWDITIVLSSIPTGTTTRRKRKRKRRTTGTTAASFMKVIERLPSEDRLSRTTMIKALPLSSATFYRKVKEYGIKLNDFVVDKKRKRVEEKEQKVSQCNTN